MMRITNYAFAAGRIGLAVLFVPMLAGLGVLIAVDRSGSIAIGAALTLLSVPFLWLAFTTPTSIRFNGRIAVGYCWGTSEYSLEDLTSFSVTTATTRMFTPETVVFSPGRRRSVRRYGVGVLCLRGGKCVKFGITAEEARRLRVHLSTRGGS